MHVNDILTLKYKIFGQLHNVITLVLTFPSIKIKGDINLTNHDVAITWSTHQLCYTVRINDRFFLSRLFLAGFHWGKKKLKTLNHKLSNHPFFLVVNRDLFSIFDLFIVHLDKEKNLTPKFNTCLVEIL